MRAPFLQQIYR